MTSLRSSARLALIASELLSRQQRSVSQQCFASLQALQLASSQRSLLDGSAIASRRYLSQQQAARGFAASSGSSSDEDPGEPDSTDSALPSGTEDVQAAADTSSSHSADNIDVTTALQDPSDLEEEKDELLSKIQSSSKKQQRHMLQRLLSGNELTGGSPITEEDGNAAINVARQTYSLRLVDVNSTNKGSPAGGIQSFSAMVVVGNHEGLLGHGTGKAAELVAAIRKASLRAINNVTYIPRYERFTILHPVDTKFGKCKLRIYPLASGGGIRANVLLGDIAALAGINSIGIKAHGSRNARNSVKALFQAFGELTTIERQAKQKGMAAVEVIVGSRPRPKQKFKYATRLTKLPRQSLVG